MAYSDPLVAAWNAGGSALPSGAACSTFAVDDTPEQKLAKLNAWTVGGPKIDVPMSKVVGYLALSGKLFLLKQFAAGSLDNTQPHDNALVAANELITLMDALPSFATSDPTTYAGVKGFLDALVANSSIAQADEDALLAFAVGAPEFWWQSAGYPGTPNEHDLVNAGLFTLEQAQANGWVS